jgi:uncharacterized Zn-binding protein involved in type VI secretion
MLAARVTDMHLCPLANGPVPHVGGVIAMGSPNVLTVGLPQARQLDACVCVGPPNMLAKGSATVYVNGLQAIRIGDLSQHGGQVAVVKQATVLIGG